MKLLLTVLILSLAAASFILGAMDHTVLAGFAAYLSVTLLLLTVWHYSRRQQKSIEAAHGCYEMEHDD